MKTINYFLIIFIFNCAYLFGCCKSGSVIIKPADPELFSDSLARVDVIASFPDWNALVSLQQWQKDDALDQILMWSAGYWKHHFDHPWVKKRRLIAAAIYAGADPNLLCSKKYYNHPLVDAAHANDFHLVQFLCNHGAKPDLVDPESPFSRLFICTKKARIARYLIEKGMRRPPDYRIFLHAVGKDHSPKLVALYLQMSNKSAALHTDCYGFTTFHQLIDVAKDYKEDDPRLFKKCNILLTHLPGEVVMALLNSGYRPANSYPWWLAETPEQYGNKLHTNVIDLGFPRGNPNAEKLSVIFKHQRELLEAKIKARQSDVP